MGFLRKLFPKKKESKDEAVTEMRATINKMTLRVRGFERKSGESKQKAREFVRQGNLQGARTHLRKWKRYTTWMNRYHRQVGSLEDVIDMIETARDTADMGRALELGLEQLEEARRLMSSEKATEVMLKTEQLVDEIERTSEMLSAAALDEGEDIDVERELAKLQEEVAIEEELPEVPTEKEAIVSEKKKDKIRKELEDIKKGLKEDIPEEEKERE
ncbi:MAG: Snf7 family protein [Candidatus Hodarchaeota archaeon]